MQRIWIVSGLTTGVLAACLLTGKPRIRTAASQHQPVMARGIVFEDANDNGKFEDGESRL